jgi:hypothetical protein
MTEPLSKNDALRLAVYMLDEMQCKVNKKTLDRYVADKYKIKRSLSMPDPLEELRKIQADRLDPERIYKAIQDGVHDAMWQMITNNTDMPCADFFETIKQGTKEGVENIVAKPSDRRPNMQTINMLANMLVELLGEPFEDNTEYGNKE